jgi:hypothetical protein
MSRIAPRVMTACTMMAKVSAEPPGPHRQQVVTTLVANLSAVSPVLRVSPSTALKHCHRAPHASTHLPPPPVAPPP